VRERSCNARYAEAGAGLFAAASSRSIGETGGRVCSRDGCRRADRLARRSAFARVATSSAQRPPCPRPDASDNARYQQCGSPARLDHQLPAILASPLRRM